MRGTRNGGPPDFWTFGEKVMLYGAAPEAERRCQERAGAVETSTAYSR